MYIFKTPAGTWAFRVDIGTDPRTGKRRQKSKQGFQRRKDADCTLFFVKFFCFVASCIYVGFTILFFVILIKNCLRRLIRCSFCAVHRRLSHTRKANIARCGMSRRR